MLSNAYFLAKFRFDTAENQPAEEVVFEVPEIPGLLNDRRLLP